MRKEACYRYSKEMLKQELNLVGDISSVDYDPVRGIVRLFVISDKLKEIPEGGEVWSIKQDIDGNILNKDILE